MEFTNPGTYNSNKPTNKQQTLNTMKKQATLSRGIVMASAVVLLGAMSLTSCSKGQHCPAYTGYKKYKKVATMPVVLKERKQIA